jgi:hypothetical protein
MFLFHQHMLHLHYPNQSVNDFRGIIVLANSHAKPNKSKLWAEYCFLISKEVIKIVTIVC